MIYDNDIGIGFWEFFDIVEACVCDIEIDREWDFLGVGFIIFFRFLDVFMSRKRIIVWNVGKLVKWEIVFEW